MVVQPVCSSSPVMKPSSYSESDSEGTMIGTAGTTSALAGTTSVLADEPANVNGIDHIDK